MADRKDDWVIILTEEVPVRWLFAVIQNWKVTSEPMKVSFNDYTITLQVTPVEDDDE